MGKHQEKAGGRCIDWSILQLLEGRRQKRPHPGEIVLRELMRPSNLAGAGCAERTSCCRREERRMRVSAGDAGLKLRLPPFMCKHLEGVGRDQHHLVRRIRSFERGKQGRQDLEEEGVRHVLVGALLGKLCCRRCGAQAVEIFPERCMGV
jgi:hypothetical protein